jgi:hypothetical protein
MKIKIFTLFIFAVFAAAAFGQYNNQTAVIQKSEVAPEIDGVIDDLWADVEVHFIDLNFQTELPTLPTLLPSGETTWQMVWVPDEGFYLLLVVMDDEFFPNYYPNGGANTWEYDKPEVYFDCNYILADALGPSGEDAGNGHHQIAPGFAEGKNDGTMLDAGVDGEADLQDAGCKYAFMVNDPDYIAEYFFPFEILTDKDGNMVDISGEIGFDVTIIDRDEGDAARKRAVWSNTGDAAGGNNESWNNMDDCGIITLEDAEPPTYIDQITLTGGEITENNGTLQIVAEVLPADNTEGKLTWSVENVTGRAKIDKNGVLTGIVDGTVTVTAQSKYEFATVDVEISNQLVSRNEINLIRNGYFDQVDADGTATEWTGNPAEVQVVDGVLTINYSSQGTEVWSYTVTQQRFGCNTEDQYWFSFVMWADEPDTFNVDFEDSNNDYNRYGTSTNEYSNGESDWTIFETPTERTHFVFDVVFNEKLENTNESCQFMVGKHQSMLYIDSVELINDNDLALISEYNPVTSITVTGADGASTVARGSTLQMSAEVLPADADYLNVWWSVVPGTGWATIDAAGLLTGDSVGTVTVVASAKDDSQVTASKVINVTWGVGIQQHDVNTLKVYPNPAVNELNVVLTNDNSRVSIYNSVGQKMDEVLVSGTEHRFDISSYPAGIYFVKTDGAIAKFIK